MPEENILHCDVMVIGRGIAGMAAAVFAKQRGLRVAQAGVTGESVYTSGVMDVMAVHPVSEGKLWDDPFAAMRAVSEDDPRHPYSRLSEDEVRAAFGEFLGFFDERGFAYRMAESGNSDVLTAMGTLKRSWAIPETMWAGAEVRRDKKPCLFIGFRGLKGFSPDLLASVQGENWPGLRGAVVEFPGSAEKGEIFPQQMAQALEFSRNREELAEAIRPHLGDAQAVGMPAILGIYHPHEVMADLSERLGVPVFEIPSLPPSVPGLRLKEAFDSRIVDDGVSLFRQKKVLSVRHDADADEFVMEVGFNEPEYTVHARCVVLGTGRFLGGGLFAERRNITESVFGLPVTQPEDRHAWHDKDFLRPGGHAVNRCGVETDECFRPLGEDGAAAYANLYACGAILAHQDWMREKCGCGLAISSAYKAVTAIAETLGAAK